jgi:hypothetical protein
MEQCKPLLSAALQASTKETERADLAEAELKAMKELLAGFDARMATEKARGDAAEAGAYTPPLLRSD